MLGRGSAGVAPPDLDRASCVHSSFFFPQVQLLFFFSPLSWSEDDFLLSSFIPHSTSLPFLFIHSQRVFYASAFVFAAVFIRLLSLPDLVRIHRRSCGKLAQAFKKLFNGQKQLPPCVCGASGSQAASVWSHYYHVTCVLILSSTCYRVPSFLWIFGTFFLV